MEKLTELNSDLTTYPIAETFHVYIPESLVREL